MAYVGNLTCDDCGLTFTARWGSYPEAQEFRCSYDHVVLVEDATGIVLTTVDGDESPPQTLVDLRGQCPLDGTELRAGLLPRCPICGSRDHDVAVAGLLS